MLEDQDSILKERDYTLIIDKSGSMSTKDQQGGRSRWDVMQESTFALVTKCEEFDPDGITVYFFSSKFRRIENVTSSQVSQLFKEISLVGRTEMALVLEDALQNYFHRKQEKQTKSPFSSLIILTWSSFGLMRFTILSVSINGSAHCLTSAITLRHATSWIVIKMKTTPGTKRRQMNCSTLYLI